jgi:hypothetical protein
MNSTAAAPKPHSFEYKGRPITSRLGDDGVGVVRVYNACRSRVVHKTTSLDLATRWIDGLAGSDAGVPAPETEASVAAEVDAWATAAGVPVPAEPALDAGMTPREVRDFIKAGDHVRVLVDGCGGVGTDDGGEEQREFKAGEIVRVDRLDQFRPPQGLAATIVSASGVVNVFDEADFDGIYPFELLGDGTPLAAGTLIDGIDCSGMTDLAPGIPVYLQPHNRRALTPEQAGRVAALAAARAEEARIKREGDSTVVSDLVAAAKAKRGGGKGAKRSGGGAGAGGSGSGGGSAKKRGGGAKKPADGKSKTAIVAGLLKRSGGCTTADILEATGWPSVSVPAMAKAAGLRLRKEKVKGSPTQYFGS